MGITGAIIASSVIGAGTSLYSANQNKKAIESAAASQKSVDIDKLIADARVNAETNLQKSLEMERKYLPGTAAARDLVTQNLLDQLSPSAAAARTGAIKQLSDFVAGGAKPTYEGSEMFKSAADQILADLELGGGLDAETQSQVVRGALSGAGGSGILGSNAGRGLVARDLGLTSLQLRNQRQQAALAAGATQSQLGLTAAQQYLQALGLNIDALTGQLGQAANLQGALAAQPLPESGLSAGDIASTVVGQNNTANQNAMTLAGMRATNNAQMMGGISGAFQQGLGLYAGLTAAGKNGSKSSTAGDP